MRKTILLLLTFLILSIIGKAQTQEYIPNLETETIIVRDSVDMDNRKVTNLQDAEFDQDAINLRMLIAHKPDTAYFAIDADSANGARNVKIINSNTLVVNDDTVNFMDFKVDTAYLSNKNLIFVEGSDTFSVDLTGFVEYNDSLTIFITPKQLTDSLATAGVAKLEYTDYWLFAEKRSGERDSVYIGAEPLLPATPSTPETKFLNGLRQWSAIIIGSGGYSANVYLSNTTSSTVPTYKQLSYLNDATVTEYSASVTNSEALIKTHIYDYPISLTTVDAGIWLINLYAKVSNAQGLTRFRIEVFARKVSDGEDSILFSTYSDEINNLTYESLRFQVAEAMFPVNATDKLGVNLYVVTNAMSSRTLTYSVGGIYPSYINTPLNLRHSQLRGQNDDPNNLHWTATDTALVVRKISANTVDNMILKTAGTGNRKIEQSGVSIDDSNNLSIPTGSTYRVNGVQITGQNLSDLNAVTTGYMPYKTATIYSTSPIFSNGTQVSVGHASPTEVLDVSGNVKALTGKFTNLTDNYIPIHTSDAVGFSNSQLSWDVANTRLNIGTGAIGLAPNSILTTVGAHTLTLTTTNNSSVTFPLAGTLAIEDSITAHREDITAIQTTLTGIGELATFEQGILGESNNTAATPLIVREFVELHAVPYVGAYDNVDLGVYDLYADSVSVNKLLVGSLNVGDTITTWVPLIRGINSVTGLSSNVETVLGIDQTKIINTVTNRYSEDLVSVPYYGAREDVYLYGHNLSADSLVTYGLKTLGDSLTLYGNTTITDTLTAKNLRLRDASEYVSGYYLKVSTNGLIIAEAISGALIYQGTWDASTNTPTLADGTGTNGYYYRVAVGGTVNLGSGNITFAAGDDALYNGTTWGKVPSAGFVLQPATASVLGGVKIGSNVNVDAAGTISVTNQTLTAGAGAGALSISGGNSVTLNVNDADYSPTNEIQGLTKSKVGNYVTLNISSGVGTGFSVADADSILTNEGILGVSAGDATSAVITSNTSGASGISIIGGTGITVSESTSTNGGTITLTPTDPSITNEIQNLSYTASTRVLGIDGTGSTDVTLPEVVAAGNSGLMTGADKTKLDGIASGAEVNVNADFNAASGTDAYIANRPTTWAPSAHTIDSHSNITISSIASGELLKWNGTAWVNNTLAEAGIQPTMTLSSIDLNSFSSASTTAGHIPIAGAASTITWTPYTLPTANPGSTSVWQVTSAGVGSWATTSTLYPTMVTASTEFSTDNRLTKTVGTTGRGIEQTGVSIDDSQNLTTTGTISSSNGKFSALSNGRIPYHVSDAAGFADGAYWDASNVRLGVGITPTQALHISGNSLITGYSYIGVNTAYLNPSSGGILFGTGSATRLTLDANGKFGIGVTPTALTHIAAGTATLAPLKFTSGTLLTTPQSGAVEFLTDRWYGTSGTTRKAFAYLQDDLTSFVSGAATNGYVPTANGSGGITWTAQTGDMLKATYDTDNNGKVDDSDKLGGQAGSYYKELTSVSGTAPLTLTYANNTITGSVATATSTTKGVVIAASPYGVAMSGDYISQNDDNLISSTPVLTDEIGFYDFTFTTNRKATFADLQTLLAIPEVDGSITNEIQNLSYTAATRILAIDGTGSTDVTLPLANATNPGLLTSADFTKLSGITTVDPSSTNELQNISYTASTRAVSISSGTGFTFPEVVAAGASGLMTGADKTKLDNITTVDASSTNEGILGVGAGSSTTSVILSNTSGAVGVTISAATGLNISESASNNGGTITLTPVDASATNEIQDLSGSGSNLGGYVLTLTGDASTVTLPNEKDLIYAADSSAIKSSIRAHEQQLLTLPEEVTEFFVSASNNQVVTLAATPTNTVKVEVNGFPMQTFSRVGTSLTVANYKYDIITVHYEK